MVNLTLAMENHKFICCVIFCLFTSTIASHDALSLDVSCEDSGMSVKIIFKRPFEGVVYSKGFYEDPICRYVPAWSGTYKMTTFLVPSTECGTNVVLSGGSRSIVNTIVVQQNPLLETALDSAHNISCDHKVFDERIISSSALHVSGKSAESFHFSDEGIETWMDIKIGTDRFSNTQADSAEVGDPLTVVIYANDGGRDYGLRVKNCIAHDNTIIDENSTVYQLSDTSGCALQPDLLSEFNVTRQTKGLSNIMAYARMNAFRFTGKDSLQLTCAVQYCQNDCPMYCLSSHVGSNNFPRVKSVEKRSVADDAYDQSNLGGQQRQHLMKYTIKELAKRLMNRRRLPKLLEAEPNFGRRLMDAEIEQSLGDGLNTQFEHQNTLIDTNFAEQDASPLTVTSVEDLDLSNIMTTNIIDEDMNTLATMDIQTFSTEELTTFKTLKYLQQEYNELTTELVNVSPTISTEDLDSYTTIGENESGRYIYNVTKTFFINTHADKSELGSGISDVSLNFSNPYCFPKFRFTLVVGLLSFFLLCLILVILCMSLYMKREKKKHRIDSFLLYNFQ